MGQQKSNLISDTMSELNGECRSIVLEHETSMYDGIYLSINAIPTFDKDTKLMNTVIEESLYTVDNTESNVLEMETFDIGTMTDELMMVFVSEFRSRILGKDYKDTSVSKDSLSEDEYNKIATKLSCSNSDIPSEIGLTDTEFTLIVMNVLLFKFIEGYNNLLDEDHKNIGSDQSKITYNLIML
jgi:hypothetical protein